MKIAPKKMQQLFRPRSLNVLGWYFVKLVQTKTVANPINPERETKFPLWQFLLIYVISWGIAFPQLLVVDDLTKLELMQCYNTNDIPIYDIIKYMICIISQYIIWSDGGKFDGVSASNGKSSLALYFVTTLRNCRTF